MCTRVLGKVAPNINITCTMDTGGVHPLYVQWEKTETGTFPMLFPMHFFVGVYATGAG